MINWFFLYQILFVIGVLILVAICIKPVIKYMSMANSALKTSESFMDVVSKKIIEGINISSNVLTSAIKPLDTIITTGVDAFGKIVKVTGNAVNTIVPPIGGIIVQGVNKTGDIIGVVGHVLETIAPPVANISTVVLDNVGKIVVATGDLVVTAVSKTGDVIGTVISNVLKLEKTATDKISLFQTAVTDKIPSIIEVVTGKSSFLVGTLEEAINKLGGVSNTFDSITANINSNVQAGTNTVKEDIDIVTGGVAGGINKVSNVIDNVFSIINAPLGYIKTAINFVKDIPGEIGKVVTKILDETLSGLKSAILPICKIIPKVSCAAFYP